jgi:putative redox protein
MKTASIKWTDGMQFIAKGDSGHGIVLDTGPEFGGEDSGSRPAELTLMALGGCTAVDVVMIRKKKRLQIDSFEVKVEADTEEEPPKIIKEFRVKFVVKGDKRFYL